ncbi:MAG: dihydroorotase [Alphaproteobacteria bacterium]
MTILYDRIFAGGTLVTPNGIGTGNVAVKDGKIAAIGDVDVSKAAEITDVSGLHVLPGVIDSQVHFREPGNEHKEDLETGARGAVQGGVTGVFEMPNTNPTTSTKEAIADKVARGTARMACDFAFYVGATAENVEELATLEREPGTCGVKIFMGSSTGSLLVGDDDTLERVLRSGTRRVAIHCEDEFRLQERQPLTYEEGGVHNHPVWRDEESARLATERLLRLAKRAGRRVHVLHVTTKDEVPMLAAAKDYATMEVTPQHLTLAAPDCYDRLGTFAQMNPPIRGQEHQDALWHAINQGIVDVIGSDHAPHTREEKANEYPATPSGMPGVQTLVPVMLTHVANGKLSLERFVDLVCHGPQRLFNIAGKGRLVVGYDADLTIVDLKRKQVIEDSWMENRSGWTPFHGFEATGWPISTILRGMTVMQDGEIVAPGQGQPMRFMECLPQA